MLQYPKEQRDRRTRRNQSSKNSKKLHGQGLACARVIASKDDAEILNAWKELDIPVVIDPAVRRQIEMEASQQAFHTMIREKLQNARNGKTDLTHTFWEHEDGSCTQEFSDGTKTVFLPAAWRRAKHSLQNGGGLSWCGWESDDGVTIIRE